MEYRLNKYVARLGFASRREADRLVGEGHVFVNGERETNPARRVDDACDTVTFDFNTATYTKAKTYIKMNKPRGYVVSTQRDEGIPVYDLLPKGTRAAPVGRLDKDSEGLLLFTDDGTVTRNIIGEGSACEKEYFVKVTKPIPDGALSLLREGLSLEGVRLKPARVTRKGARTFTIVLTEGKNRQIRKMCRAVGHAVSLLKRERIHTVTLGRLARGKCTPLTDQEVAALTALSTKGGRG